MFPMNHQQPPNNPNNRATMFSGLDPSQASAPSASTVDSVISLLLLGQGQKSLSPSPALPPPAHLGAMLPPASAHTSLAAQQPPTSVNAMDTLLNRALLELQYAKLVQEQLSGRNLPNNPVSAAAASMAFNPNSAAAAPSVGPPPALSTEALLAHLLERTQSAPQPSNTSSVASAANVGPTTSNSSSDATIKFLRSSRRRQHHEPQMLRAAAAPTSFLNKNEVVGLTQVKPCPPTAPPPASSPALRASTPNERVVPLKDAKNKHRAGAFPQKLYQMLSDLKRQDLTHIAAFLPHGKAFEIRKPDEFVRHVMPKYFRMSRFSSFQRQLNLYDFLRITEGPDKGSYYHEMFVQGNPSLLSMLKRNKIKGNKAAAPAAAEQQQPAKSTADDEDGASAHSEEPMDADEHSDKKEDSATPDAA